MSILCGGVQKVDNLDDPVHHELIQAALTGTAAHSGRAYKIIRATSQVVAGSLYTFFITFDDDASQEVFKITAWSRPWLQERDPTEALKLTFEKHVEKSRAQEALEIKD